MRLTGRNQRGTEGHDRSRDRALLRHERRISRRTGLWLKLLPHHWRIPMSEKHESEMPPLPFLNPEFMNSPAARTVRILSEYLEPAERLRRLRIRDTIVFFGSARSASPEEAAEQLALVNAEIERTGTTSTEL